MATQVKAESSKAIASTNDSALSMLESALGEVGGEALSNAGDTSVDASDSMDDSEEPVDIEDVEAEIPEGEEGDEGLEGVAEGVEKALTGKEVPKGKNKVLEVDITDDQGKRRIKLDLGDEKLMVRNAQQAAGARKLYSGYKERGEVIARISSDLGALKASHAQEMAPFQQLDQAYINHGIDGVVRALEGKTLDQLVDERVAWKASWAKMSPAEKAAWQAQQDKSRAENDARAAREELAASRKKFDEDTTAGKVANLGGLMHGEFHRRSFAGKLGSKVEELRYDRAFWNHFQAEVVAAEASGKSLDARTIRQIANHSFEAFRGFARKSTERGTKAALNNRKEKATKAAQTRMVKSDRAATRAVDTTALDLGSTAGISALMASAMTGKKSSKKRR